MNEKFFTLPEEKQLKIINAALEVFAQNEYKHAVTDDIAAKAGISKGLLFYYFYNKKSLYVFLYHYCEKIMLEEVYDDKFTEITDFFEMLEYGAKKKVAILERVPFITEFVLKSCYTQNEVFTEELSTEIQSTLDTVVVDCFKNIDLSKFKDDINIDKVISMMMWMADGYMNEKQRKGEKIVFDDIMEEFNSWISMFKKMAYKEEYQ